MGYYLVNCLIELCIINVVFFMIFFVFVFGLLISDNSFCVLSMLIFFIGCFIVESFGVMYCENLILLKLIIEILLGMCSFFVNIVFIVLIVMLLFE